MNKNIDYNKLNLKKCKCGGDVVLWGGIPSYQGYQIYCKKCGGCWNFPNIYSPKEVIKKWGVEKNI